LPGDLPVACLADAVRRGEATVKSHINHLFAKTRVRDRARAVSYAYHHGFAPRR
jgi:DNA-binding NarL/FixJ family response regulator